MMNTMKQSQWEMGHKVVKLHHPSCEGLAEVVDLGFFGGSA